jgi:hypothetical protein
LYKTSGTHREAEIPLKNTGNFSISLIARNNVSSSEEKIWSIQVVPVYVTLKLSARTPTKTYMHLDSVNPIFLAVGTPVRISVKASWDTRLLYTWKRNGIIEARGYQPHLEYTHIQQGTVEFSVHIGFGKKTNSSSFSI